MIAIRKAQIGDEIAIFQLIKELANYEKAPKEVSNTIPELRQHLFEDQLCSAIVASKDEEIIGFALYYISYSTWKGKCLYLEDFFVKQEHRKLGVGSMLFKNIIKIAENNQAKRLDWLVLDWNDPAIAFYKKHKTELDSGWICGRITFKN
ncbi:MAG: GNAT family N-acetyltransferase [Crocinitomicaceae bacterium]|nr:GNAT family N-acetyltransferase [Crocinitomicaceae bacterium]